jgi:DNA-directed RNA polymerase subunit RPC12/RpoP
MICPTCHSKYLRKSKSGNARLVFPFSLFVVSVRCYNCGRRFLRAGLFPGSKITESAEKRQAVA